MKGYNKMFIEISEKCRNSSKKSTVIVNVDNIISMKPYYNPEYTMIDTVHGYIITDKPVTDIINMIDEVYEFKSLIEQEG